MQDDQSGNAQRSRPTPGMAGATGREPMPDTFANPDAADTAPGLAERVGMRGQDRTPKMDTPRESRATQSTGTAGGVRGGSTADLEPGTPGGPGTPTPGPLGAEATADEAAVDYDPSQAEPPTLARPGDAPHSPTP